MGFLKKDIKNKNLIVLDIGSQFLKASLLEINEEGKQEIKFNIKESILGKDLFPSCQKVVKKIKNKSKIKNPQIFLGLDEKFVKGISTAFCHKRENPNQKIDSSEIKYLVQRVQWKAFERIRKQFLSETDLSEIDLKIIDAHILDIRVDNNSVSNCLGLPGENLYLTLFNTYTSKEKLEEISRLISRLKLELIGLNIHPYALFRCLNPDLFKKDALIINIRSRTTEISIIKDKGDIIETKSFHLGSQRFIRTLADFLGLEPEEAEIVRNQYVKNGVSYEVKRKLEKLFNPSVYSWLSGVKVVLNEFFKKHKSVPVKVFLFGEGSDLPGIKKALEKERNFQVILTPSDSALINLALEAPREDLTSSTIKRVLKLVQK